jgi:hypothetical protein
VDARLTRIDQISARSIGGRVRRGEIAELIVVGVELVEAETTPMVKRPLRALSPPTSKASAFKTDVESLKPSLRISAAPMRRFASL